MELSLKTKLLSPRIKKLKMQLSFHGYGGDGEDISMLTLNWRRFFT